MWILAQKFKYLVWLSIFVKNETEWFLDLSKISTGLWKDYPKIDDGKHFEESWFQQPLQHFYRVYPKGYLTDTIQVGKIVFSSESHCSLESLLLEECGGTSTANLDEIKPPSCSSSRLWIRFSSGTALPSQWWELQFPLSFIHFHLGSISHLLL